MIQGQCKFSLHKSPILRQLTLTSSSHGKFSSLIAVTAVFPANTDPIQPKFKGLLRSLTVEIHRLDQCILEVRTSVFILYGFHKGLT